MLRQVFSTVCAATRPAPTLQRSIQFQVDLARSNIPEEAAYVGTGGTLALKVPIAERWLRSEVRIGSEMKHSLAFVTLIVFAVNLFAAEAYTPPSESAGG